MNKIPTLSTCRIYHEENKFLSTDSSMLKELRTSTPQLIPQISYKYSQSSTNIPAFWGTFIHL